MAKAKEEQVKMSFEEKAKELSKRFSRGEEQSQIVIPSGSISLDKALGGGYRTKRIFEYIAWEGAGKSTLCLHAVAEAQRLGYNVAYIDAEHALDEVYAKKIGVDWEALKPTLFQPMNGEEAFEFGKELIGTGDLRLCIFDSTSGMKPRKEMEDPAGSSNLGLHARLMGTEIPKIVTLASIHNCAVIFVSQFREKIGVMFGSPETTQGGNALKYWASVRTEIRKSLDKVGDDVVGITSRFKVIKNKIVPPYQTGEIPIVFGEGISKTEEVKNLLKELQIVKERMGVLTVVETGAKYTLKEFEDSVKDPTMYNDWKDTIIHKLNEEKEAKNES